jgi:CBS domain-containing protein
MKVADIMVRSVITAGPDATVHDLARRMLDTRCGSVVITEGDEVVGIVTREDLQISTRRVPHSMGTVRAPSLLDEFMGDERQMLEAAARVRAVPARNVMTQPVTTITSRESVWDAADILLSERIAHLPVMDDGRLVGIVTRLDLLRLIADAPDAAPERGDSR